MDADSKQNYCSFVCLFVFLFSDQKTTPFGEECSNKQVINMGTLISRAINKDLHAEV